MTDWRVLTLRGTVGFVVASGFLIGAGLLGLEGTVPLAVFFTVVSAIFAALGSQLARLPHLAGYDLGLYGRDLWFGPGVAAVVTIGYLGSSPGELTALGGLVGLLGMVNYFLRPVYGAGIWMYRRVVRVVS